MAPATSGEWTIPRLNHAVIALFIAKSKPTNLSVRGKRFSCSFRDCFLMASPAFIVNLRGFIQKGRRGDLHGNDGQFLDSVAFWRNACEKSQEVEQQLRAKIIVLERKLEIATSASSQSAQSIGTSQRKRKRENPTTKTRSGGRATKRAKTPEAPAIPQVIAMQPVLIGLDLDLDEEGTECKQSIYFLSNNL